MIRLLFRRLRRDRKGATLIEFALVAPILMIVVMGLLDMTYRLYATAMLNGEVQKAARDATLEMNASGAGQTALDTRIKTAFKQVNGTVTDTSFSFTRRNFTNFTNAGKKEPSTGPSGLCATGYTYVDTNNSGTWDDGAIAGQGGADDVTLYTVQVTYKSLFPVNALYGGPVNQTITATTVLRNQPYNDQAGRTSGPTRSC